MKLSQKNMSPGKDRISTATAPKSNTPQWLQMVFIGASLVAIWSWTANHYSNGLTGRSMLEYLKNTMSGEIIASYGSSLTEPWNKVCYGIHHFCGRIYFTSGKVKTPPCCKTIYKSGSWVSSKITPNKELLLWWLSMCPTRCSYGLEQHRTWHSSRWARGNQIASKDTRHRS